MGWTTRNISVRRQSQRELFGKLAFTEHEWLTEVKYCDVLIMSRLPVELGVLRLAADGVALLPVYRGPVVVPGPHGQTLD